MFSSLALLFDTQLWQNQDAPLHDPAEISTLQRKRFLASRADGFLQGSFYYPLTRLLVDFPISECHVGTLPLQAFTVSHSSLSKQTKGLYPFKLSQKIICGSINLILHEWKTQDPKIRRCRSYPRSRIPSLPFLSGEESLNYFILWDLMRFLEGASISLGKEVRLALTPCALTWSFSRGLL